MKGTELITLLDGVRSRGLQKWSAKCPAHADRSPSLSIAEGEKGLLVKCWAGCTLQEVTSKLGISVKDLFFDALPGAQRHEFIRRRTKEWAALQRASEAKGRRMDALRQAEYLLSAAQGLSIEHWSDEQLDAALERLARAYALLDSEAA